MEPTAGAVLFLAATTRRNEDRRFHRELERIKRLRLPSLRSGLQEPFEDQEGASIISIGNPVLAQCSVVPTRFGASDRRGASHEAGRRVADVTYWRTSPPAVMVSRMETLRRRFTGQGLSSPVVNLLLEGSRRTTRSAYQSAWNHLHSWCLEHGLDSVSADLNPVLEYLTELHAAGYSYSLLNLHRSMLSSTLEQSGTIPVGQLPSVKQLLKGAFNRNPPRPRYDRTWDVSKVVDLIASWGPNESLDLSRLTRKLAMLLALATLLRTSELSSISFDSVQFTEDGATFTLGRPRKSQRSGALQSVKIKKLDDPLVCPVHCLGTYRALTDVCRTESNNERLLIGLISPFKNVSASTVSRWIKLVLKEAGVEAIFSAHSTRGAAASRGSGYPDRLGFEIRQLGRGINIYAFL